MSKRNIEAIYPLSPMQQGMLFHTLYAPDSEVYMEQTIATLRGPLDAAHFEQAWHAMLQRHTILRTSFAWKKLEQMLQIVHKQVALPFHQEDWRSLSAEEQRTRLDEFVRADRQEGFNLAKPPLLRLALFRLADDVHQIIISAHHIILDGWSLPLLVKELMTAYESLAQGQGPLLPPVRPYRDYINWLQKQDQAAAEAFWRQQLQGFSAPTPLVVERPQPGQQGYRETEVRLSAETTAALQQLARQHQVTLNTLFQAAYALLLHRYSGEEDILFGATVSGRPADLPGAESIIGLFINTLPVRVQFTPRMRVTDLLAQLMVQQGALRQYEYSSLVQIQEWSDVPPGAPLFNSILVFENYPVDETLRQRQGSLVIDDVYANEQTNYPLTVVSGPGREMALKVSYDRSRFAGATIDRLLGHLKTILESFVADAEQPVTAVPLLTPYEITQLVHAWNDNAVPFDARLIHDWFEETAVRFPDTPAVIFEDFQLTYRELDARANQLAHYLQKQGVGPESIVAICADHSPEMIVAAVGVLKAGGAYLPLDPANPSDRLAYMLEDSGAKVLLTTAEIQQTIFEPLPIVNRQSKIVNLDADWPHIAQEPAAKPASPVTPENLAYLIYTSGSTGLPKGTLLEHRGLCNYIGAFVPLWNIRHGTQALLFSSFSFDAATADIFMALLSGATLHLAPRSQLMSADALSDLLRARAISYVTLPPAMWRALPAGDYAALESATSAGEALTPEIIARWAPGRRFFNGYGPTENTIGASVTLVLPATTAGEQTAIGHPTHNIRAYVLDAQQQPVPVGAPGELCLAGASLARGYLGRPELTAEKFIPDPFSLTPGARMYRTGDLVAFRPDGSMDFLGRIDFQVKIRGYRVELGEIEALLGAHPGLRQTAVIANSDWRAQPQIKPDGEADPANLEIVAYITPQPDHEPGAGELREFLSARLPDYMLPARYVVVAEMPLTSSGKIDRRRLPALDGQQLFSADGYVPPRTPAEELLANIWAQVLGAERVGAHDNFFELGGQSLLATRLATRLRDAFDVEVPLRHIFERPTVAELAETIQALQVGEELIAPPIEPAPRGESLPLSFAQQRLWFLDQLEPNSPYYNIATAVRLSGPLDAAALQRSVNDTVARHETLRTTFTAVAGQPRQVIADTLTLDLPVTDLSRLPADAREAEVRRLATEEARHPFDLATGPLIRAQLLRLADDEHIGLFTVHHIVADGWSMSVLIREVGARYQGFVSDNPVSLPPLRVQYADFAQWQRNWLQGEVLEKQLAYWEAQLRGSPPLLDLPTDRPRPAVQTANGDHIRFELTPALSQALEELSQQAGVTLFMTLMAAFQTLLYRYSDQTDISVGTPIANRTRAEIEGLIGFFVNTLIMRSDLSAAAADGGGDLDFLQLVKQVRETALGAYAHQDLPFEMLVEKLQPERDLSHTPLFQVMFVLDNNPPARIELPDITLSPVEAESGTAKFDLTLSLAPGPDNLAGYVEYNTDLFNRSTIERLLGHFRTLLEGIVADPQQKIATLPMLTEGELRQLLVDWNATAVPYPDNSTIHALFEEQAAQRPDAPAVIKDNFRLSYAELDRKANQLAHYLRRQGVQPGSFVGLMTGRSPEMVVGILGALKAGAAYIPIDPTYPPERQAFMIEDAQPAVILTIDDLGLTIDDLGLTIDDLGLTIDDLGLTVREAVADSDIGDSQPQAQLVKLDADWPTIAQQPESPPDVAVTADDLAYLIYTSGSTGQPKGTMLRHRGLCNLATWHRKAFGLRPGESRILQFSPLSFDASVWETVMALRNGAALVLADQETLASGDALAALLRAQRVTTVTLPPSMLAVMPDADLPDLETIVAAGEACPAELVQRWGQGRQFVNAYGPTETTVCASMYECDPAEESNPPIGRPIDNFQLYVLDANLQPVPVGVPGELCVGGVGLAQGYLNRPEMTAQKFISNPFVAHSALSTQHSLLYRTGDLVRYRPDGNLEFLGRIDHQVKVRGFRIELGEIEAALEQHPDVQSTAVLAREDTPGDKRLVGYVVPKPDRTLEINDLRSALRARLPEYMTPLHWVILEQMPLTPSNKIDRKALPAPDISRDNLAREYVAPRNATEEKLCAIAMELLNLDKVGVHDSFFELGGHSLLATQFVSRVRSSFDVELPLRTLFGKPTAAEIAREIEALSAAGSTARNGSRKKIEDALAQVGQLSPEELKALLAAKKAERAAKAKS